jgi:hypothetical protein
MLSFHYGNVNRNTSIRITLKIDGKQSSDTPTTVWIAVVALLISGSFLALSYVIFCLNHCVDPNLADGTKSPFQVAT